MKKLAFILVVMVGILVLHSPSARAQVPSNSSLLCSLLGVGCFYTVSCPATSVCQCRGTDQAIAGAAYCPAVVLEGLALTNIDGAVCTTGNCTGVFAQCAPSFLPSYTQVTCTSR
jgi:hypothetical protein